MRGQVVDASHANESRIDAVPSPVINPVIRYGIAAVVGFALWAMLLTAIF